MTNLGFVCQSANSSQAFRLICSHLCAKGPIVLLNFFNLCRRRPPPKRKQFLYRCVSVKAIYVLVPVWTCRWCFERCASAVLRSESLTEFADLGSILAVGVLPRQRFIFLPKYSINWYKGKHEEGKTMVTPMSHWSYIELMGSLHHRLQGHRRMK